MIWRQRLQRSLHVSRSKPESRYIQLATVDAQGKVQNRTVVFRGLADIGAILYFVTDKASDKFRALTQHAQAEIAWYFAKTREQYRLSVQCELLTHDVSEADLAVRRDYWQRLSHAAKQQFLDDAPIDITNSTALGGDVPNEDSELSQSTLSDSIPPTNFVLVRAHVEWVDYLVLSDPQQRYTYAAHNEWLETAIRP